MQFALNFVLLRRQMSKVLKRDTMDDFDSEAWLARNPEIGNLRAAIFDLNGVLRGKRLPRSQLKKAINGGIRMPLSAANLDIWGRDIANSNGSLKLVIQMAAVSGPDVAHCQCPGLNRQLRWCH